MQEGQILYQLDSRRLVSLAGSIQGMMSNLDAMALQDRLMLIARYTVEVLQAEASGVFLVRGNELVLEASHGQKGEFEPGKVKLPLHNRPRGGLTGYIAYQGELFKDHGKNLIAHPAVAGSATHTPSPSCYSLLAIPLKRKGKVVGLIRADNKKGEDDRALDTLGFTREDESILTIFAEAAQVAIESHELVDNLKKRKERESLLLRASNIVARASGLDAGLRSLAEMMVSLLGRSFCDILLMDEERRFMTLRASSMAGNPDWKPVPHRIVPSAWMGLQDLLVAGHPQLLERSDGRSRSVLKKLRRLLAFPEDIESLLVVPLKLDDQLIGQLDLGELRSDARNFPPEEIELITAIASQITVLVDRMQLLEIRERHEQLRKALVTASVHVRGEVDRAQLLQTVARLAAELAGCRAAGLFLNHAPLCQLELAAVYGLPEKLVSTQLSHEDGLIGNVAREGTMETRAGAQPEELFSSLKLQAVAAAPLRGAAGEIMAVLFVGDETEQVHFGRIDREILEDFAAQAAIALRTSRLIGKEQRFFNQLSILHRISDYIQTADELERILLTVLTGVTANFGLGFNRAMLMLVDETGEELWGEMGIGEVEEPAARSAWTTDEEQGLDNFERFRRRLEAGEIVPATSTVGRKIRGLRLSIGGNDVFSEVVASGKLRKISLEEYPLVPPAFSRLFRITTPLVVAPLIAKGQVIGILVVDNKFTQTPIGDDSCNALLTFASTAAVAIDNKRLFDQTRSGATKLVSFYQMIGELIALQDPKTILDRIVHQTTTAAGASWVSILLIDEKGRFINPIISDPRFTLDPRDPEAVRPHGISIEVMRTGKAFPVENIDRMRDRVNSTLIKNFVKAAICLPLSLPTKKIGVMWIHYDMPRRFADSEVAALQLYVNQAAIAYDSALRMERLEHLRAISNALAEAKDVDSVVKTVVDGARRLLRADDAVLWLFDAGTENFIPESSAYAGDHPAVWSQVQKTGPQPHGTAFKIMGQDWICAEDIQDPIQANVVGARTRRFLEDIGGRGFQGVSLKVGREKLGVLYAIHAKPCRSDNEEKETALAFASHAALALKKARLFDQVQRAREAADVVARVTLLEDRRSTLVSIAREVREALACGAVVLFEFDQEAGDLVLPPAVAGVNPPMAPTIADPSLVLAMVERDKPYIVFNVALDERFKDSPFALAQGIQSCAVFPLRAAGRKVGVMFINYRNPRTFTADELATMELFANQAAVAIRNAQLFDELATKLAQQEQQYEAGLRKSAYLAALYDASKAITAQFGIKRQEILDRIVQAAIQSTSGRHGPKATLGTIELFDPETRKLSLESLYPGQEYGDVVRRIGEKRSIIPSQQGNHSIGITGRAVLTNQPQLVDDVTLDPDFVEYSPSTASELAVPLLHRGRVMGVLNVESDRSGAFDLDDLQALEALAKLAVAAIKNAEQLDELKETKLRAGRAEALSWRGMGNKVVGHNMIGHLAAMEIEIGHLEDDLKGIGDREAEQRLVHLRAMTKQAKSWSKKLAAESSRNTVVGVNSTLRSWLQRREIVRPGSSVRFELRPELDDLVQCRVSVGLLEEVLDILADNAVTATAGLPRRQIVVGSRLNKSKSEIYVSDNGKGIPPRIRKYLFRKQIKKSRRSKTQGMGLLMAHAIVQRLGGSIEAIDGPSRGATIVISLPIVDPPLLLGDPQGGTKYGDHSSR